MRNRERQQWTEYVRQLEERKEKAEEPRAKKRPRPSQAELDAVLDDLTGAAPEKREA